MKTTFLRLCFYLLFTLYPYVWASQEYGEQQPLIESLMESDILQSDSALSQSVGDVQAYFEGFEHNAIGDAVMLRYDDKNISGRQFQYMAKNVSLDFGQVVALAGDFYANWRRGGGDDTQISDLYVSKREESITLFTQIAKSLSDDVDDYLLCKVTAMLIFEDLEIQMGIRDGKDSAQVYESISTRLDFVYSLCTLGGFPLIALENWDHFGIDATYSYSAGHIAALRQAKVARGTQNATDLKQAYFLEAFALHYLTDLFSTGHLRVPRRKLHRTYFDEPEEQGFFDWLYPADSLARRQHNEDSANGLWVRNKLGDAWPAYGDKHLYNGKSGKNHQQVIRAAQVSISEIWDTYSSGVEPDPGDFKALQIVPNFDEPNINSIPLFVWNETENMLFFRHKLDGRNDPKFDNLTLPQTLSQWNSMLQKVDEAQPFIVMYPFSQSFNSTSVTVHFRQLPNSSIVVNFYGPLDPGPLWNMMAQTVMVPTSIPANVKWISADRIGTAGAGGDVYFLTGSSLSSQNQVSMFQLAINISDYRSSPTELWSLSGFIKHDERCTLIEAFEVDWDSSGETIGIVGYWKCEMEDLDRVEIYSAPANFSQTPIWKRDEGVANISFAFPFAFPHRIQPSLPPSIMVTISYDIGQQEAQWYFTSWSVGHEVHVTQSIKVSNRVAPQKTLNGILAGGANASIVQLYYGSTAADPENIRVEVVELIQNLDSSVTIPPACSNKTFPLTWSARKASEYIHWFLSDVNGDNFTDLVGYTSTDSNTTLTILVFPGTETCAFGSPVVSNITFPKDKGSDFTTSFMAPLYTRRADFIYKKSEGIHETLKSAILSYFDNFGILGARMLAPINQSSYEFEFKGQIPAIAGQISNGLGWRPQNHMGLGEPGVAVGFAEGLLSTTSGLEVPCRHGTDQALLRQPDDNPDDETPWALVAYSQASCEGPLVALSGGRQQGCSDFSKTATPYMSYRYWGNDTMKACFYSGAGCAAGTREDASTGDHHLSCLSFANGTTSYSIINATSACDE